jgi:hypothetical protein
MAINTRQAAERAYPSFVVNKWTWYHTNGEPPTVDQIEDTINFLINSVEESIIMYPDESHLSGETGRLCVNYSRLEDDEVGEMSVSLKLGTDLDDYASDAPAGNHIAREAAKAASGAMRPADSETQMERMPLSYTYVGSLQLAGRAIAAALDATADDVSDGKKAAENVAKARQCIENIYKQYAEGVTH